MEDVAKISVQTNYLHCDFIGFASIAQLNYLFNQKNPNTHIQVDLTSLNFLESGLCSPLSAIINKYGPDEVHLIFQSGKVITQLQRNGFHSYIHCPPLSSVYTNQIQLHRFELYDEQVIGTYLGNQFYGKKMPEMSDLAKQKLLRSLLELFDNAFSHSKTAGNVCICGQVYPKLNRLGVTITDLGTGIQQCVNNAYNFNYSTQQAIEWAIIGGNSTRLSKGPKGYGLAEIIDFLNLNNGRILILTNEGMWEKIGNGNPVYKRIEHNFCGTVIHIDIRTDDPNIYCLRNE